MGCLLPIAEVSTALAGDSLRLSRPVERQFSARVEAERLLGSDSEVAQARICLPFTRQIGISGFVTGSLAASTAAAGVPAAAMLEALRAFGTTLDREGDFRDGDSFHVRYEQTFTVQGQPIGVGRVLWAELRSSTKGTIAIHRFRSRDGSERFWLASGQAATSPPIRMPVDTVSISSGFGLRFDPLDKPSGTALAMGPLTDPVATPAAKDADASVPEQPPSAPPKPVRRFAVGGGLGFSGIGGARDFFDAGRTVGPRAAVAPSTEAPVTTGMEEATVAKPPVATPAGRRAPMMFMHEGIDLVAPSGTPVYAAADGFVLGAAPNGSYGNWIQIDHPGKLSTVYGHLSGFAPGIVAGARVSQGELIGFVGNTGRSTGPHLHFEFLSGGRAVDPLGRPEVKRVELLGSDLERFRGQVKKSIVERDRETATAIAVASFRD